MKRIYTIDTAKGVAISVMIILHAAIYHYGKLDEIDITNPPLVIMVIGVLAFWGGLFGVISGLVNTYRYELRVNNREEWDGPPIVRRLFLTGLGVYLFHLLYSAVAAPTALDFAGLDHSYGLVANLLRNGSAVVDPERLTHGTSLQMLGFNLMGLAVCLPILSRRESPEAASLVVALVFLATGLIRIRISPAYFQLLEGEHFLRAALLSPFAAEPYPVFPYFAFGLTGAAMGFRMARGGRIPDRYGIIGGALLALGLAGVVVFPTNLQDPGPFWYAKVFLELGVFTLIAWAVIRVGSFGRDRGNVLQLTARISLTVYTLSTPLAEVLGAGLTATVPGWNDTIPKTMLFAVANAALWLGIVALWRKAGFAGTLEHLWIRLSHGSTKLKGVR